MPRLVKCKVCGRRVSEDAAQKVKGGFLCPPCSEGAADGSVEIEELCRVCRRQISGSEIREIKGLVCCPSCYAKVRTKLQGKEKEREESGTEEPSEAPDAPDAPETPARVRVAPTVPSSHRPLSASEKLAARAGMGGGGGARRGMPDLPSDFLNSIQRDAERRPGFGIGPAWIGHAIYTALLGLAAWGIAHGVAGEGEGRRLAVLVLGGLATGLGVPAVAIGIAEAVRSGEVVKQFFGGVGAALGLFLVFYVGKGFVADLKGLPHPADVILEEGPDKPKPGTGTTAEKPPAGKEPKKPGPSETPPPPKPVTTTEPPKPVEPVKPRMDPRVELRVKLRKALAAAAAEASKLGNEAAALSCMTEQKIQTIEFSNAIDAEVVEGEVDVALGTVQKRRFLYSARAVGSEREVVGFGLPEDAVRLEKTEGAWKLIALETTDPLIRYRRGLMGLDAGSLPVSNFGEAPGSKTLQPYGKLIAADGRQVDVTGGAGGAILVMARNRTYADLLAAVAGQGKDARLAILVAGVRGQIYPLPDVTAEERQARLKTVTLEAVPGGDGKWELRLTGQTYRSDAQGFGMLAGRIKDLARVGSGTSGIGGLPVRIAPAREASIELVVKLVDCCMQAGVKLNLVTLQP